MTQRQENKHQVIIKYSSRTSFLEVSSFSFPIDKVIFKFMKFDPNKPGGSKAVAEIDIYLSFEDVFYIYYGLFGSQNVILKRMKQNELNFRQAGGQGYPQKVSLYMGGSRTKGGLVAKNLSISLGSKKPILLEASQGPGEEVLGTKLIKMSGPANQRVLAAFDVEDMYHILSSTIEAIRAYKLAKEVHEFKDKYMFKNRERQVINTQPPQNLQSGGFNQEGNYQYQDNEQDFFNPQGINTFTLDDV